MTANALKVDLAVPSATTVPMGPCMSVSWIQPFPPNTCLFIMNRISTGSSGVWKYSQAVTVAPPFCFGYDSAGFHGISPLMAD